MAIFPPGLPTKYPKHDELVVMPLARRFGFGTHLPRTIDMLIQLNLALRNCLELSVWFRVAWRDEGLRRYKQGSE